MIQVEARNQCNKALAAKMLEVAEKKAETIQIIGQGEAQISDVMKSRRHYEYLNEKLEVIKAFKNNQNLKVFGDNNDDVMSQVAAFKVTQGNGQII